MVSYFVTVWGFECSINIRLGWVTGTVLGFECLLNVSIWWVSLEAFDALNAPWILTYVELLWKCLMLWMFLNCLHMVSYFGSVWCFKCSLNVSIWWVTLEAFDALNVPSIFDLGELLWNRLMLWMLNVSIWSVTLEVFDALNVPWMFT